MGNTEVECWPTFMGSNLHLIYQMWSGCKTRISQSWSLGSKNLLTHAKEQLSNK